MAKLIDSWMIGDKEAELWLIDDSLQIRHRGTIHNVPVSAIPKSEQKVGEWNILPPMFEEICECSCCRKMFKEMLQFTDKCPSCGAYMKGIKKH